MKSKKAGGQPVAALSHNLPAAYLIPTEVYAIMMSMIEYHQLSELVDETLTGEEIVKFLMRRLVNT